MNVKIKIVDQNDSEIHSFAFSDSCEIIIIIFYIFSYFDPETEVTEM